jgi:molecular chaperone GrpE
MVKKEKVKKKDEIQKHIEDLKRVQADFENYVKRVEKEKQDLIEYGTHKLISKFLHIVDEFENAIKAIEKAEKKEDIVSGINMIYSDLKKSLEEEGVKGIESLGETFDPYRHDCIGYENGEEDKVVEEVKRGYMFKSKVLRPSIVKVGKEGKNE